MFGLPNVPSATVTVQWIVVFPVATRLTPRVFVSLDSERLDGCRVFVAGPVWVGTCVSRLARRWFSGSSCVRMGTGAKVGVSLSVSRDILGQTQILMTAMALETDPRYCARGLMLGMVVRSL